MPLKVTWERTKKQHKRHDGRLETFGPRRGDSSRVSLYLRDTSDSRANPEPFALKWNLRVPYFCKSARKTAYANVTAEPSEIRDALARIAEMIRYCNEQYRFRSDKAQQLTSMGTLLEYVLEKFDQLEAEKRTPRSANNGSEQKQ